MTVSLVAVKQNSCHWGSYQVMEPKYSGASAYEHPYLRPFRVMASSGCKILLLLATGASTYKQKKAGEKGGKFKLLTVGGERGCFFVALSPRQLVCV